MARSVAPRLASCSRARRSDSPITETGRAGAAGFTATATGTATVCSGTRTSTGAGATTTSGNTISTTGSGGITTISGTITTSTGTSTTGSMTASAKARSSSSLMSDSACSSAFSGGTPSPCPTSRRIRVRFLRTSTCTVRVRPLLSAVLISLVDLRVSVILDFGCSAPRLPRK